MKYRDRIVGLIRVRGDRILPHPKNFRTHPENQKDALRGALADVGIGDALIVVPADEAQVREVAALKGAERDAWLRAFDASAADVLLLDGHLRAEEIRDQPIPVLVLDLNAREQAEFLALFDPLGDLAGFDREKFLLLAEDFNSTNPAVQALVADLAKIETSPMNFGLEGDGATGGAGPDEDVGDGPPARDPEPPRVSLAERFGVPPFSVLNAREGWWQSRKAAWIALGLRSEMGRGGAGRRETHDERHDSGVEAERRPGREARGGGQPNAAPGGSPRPAMKLRGGKTVRGDGRGHAIG